jgi:hypothetical protein
MTACRWGGFAVTALALVLLVMSSSSTLLRLSAVLLVGGVVLLLTPQLRKRPTQTLGDEDLDEIETTLRREVDYLRSELDQVRMRVEDSVRRQLETVRTEVETARNAIERVGADTLQYQALAMRTEETRLSQGQTGEQVKITTTTSDYRTGNLPRITDDHLNDMVETDPLNGVFDDKNALDAPAAWDTSWEDNSVKNGANSWDSYTDNTWEPTPQPPPINGAGRDLVPLNGGSSWDAPQQARDASLPWEQDTGSHRAQQPPQDNDSWWRKELDALEGWDAGPARPELPAASAASNDKPAGEDWTYGPPPSLFTDGFATGDSWVAPEPTWEEPPADQRAAAGPPSQWDYTGQINFSGEEQAGLREPQGWETGGNPQRPAARADGWGNAPAGWDTTGPETPDQQSATGRQRFDIPLPSSDELRRDSRPATNGGGGTHGRPAAPYSGGSTGRAPYSGGSLGRSPYAGGSVGRLSPYSGGSVGGRFAADPYGRQRGDSPYSGGSVGGRSPYAGGSTGRYDRNNGKPRYNSNLVDYSDGSELSRIYGKDQQQQPPRRERE